MSIWRRRKARTEQDAPINWEAIARQRERELRAVGEARHKAVADRDEARMWARAGYEIGQRSCTWSDHGVAPAWLTEGWPPSFWSDLVAPDEGETDGR